MILFSHDPENVEFLPPVPHATLTHTKRVRVYVGEEDLHLHFVGGTEAGSMANFERAAALPKELFVTYSHSLFSPLTFKGGLPE